MTNPYKASGVTPTANTPRRGVRRYIAGCILFLFAGINVVSPGLLLLNQDWQFVPSDYFIHDIGINGHPVSNETVVRHSIGWGSTLLVVSVMLSAKSLINWRHNRVLSDKRKERTGLD